MMSIMVVLLMIDFMKILCIKKLKNVIKVDKNSKLSSIKTPSLKLKISFIYPFNL